jgi:hypothetical protein
MAAPGISIIYGSVADNSDGIGPTLPPIRILGFRFAVLSQADSPLD